MCGTPLQYRFRYRRHGGFRSVADIRPMRVSGSLGFWKHELAIVRSSTILGVDDETHEYCLGPQPVRPSGPCYSFFTIPVAALSSV